MSPVLLGVLVLLDGALCGFRAAAGRNPRLKLTDYYRASVLRGLCWAAVVVVVFLLGALLLRAVEPSTWPTLVSAAEAMVTVYGLYALVTLSALALYVVGHFDFAVLSTVLILGPFTLARPWVIVGGAAFAIWRVPTLPAALFTASGALVMFSFEQLLTLGRPPWRGLLPK